MELTGLLSNILKSASRIDQGRKGLSTDGEEHQGRLSYKEKVIYSETLFSFSSIASSINAFILFPYNFACFASL